MSKQPLAYRRKACPNCGYRSKSVKNKKPCPRCEVDPYKTRFGLKDKLGAK